MDLLKIMQAANKGYTARELELAPGQEPICSLEGLFDPATGKADYENLEAGDGLARFVVVELSETYDEGDEDQVTTAIDAIQKAIEQLEGVRAELEKLQ